MKENSILFRAKILKGWDLPQSPNPDDEVGVFGARESEQDLLSHIMLNKTRASVLLGGSRGTGKTSLLYKTIRDLLSGKKSIIPILIDAPQLEAKIKDGDDINYEIVLENIISNLNINIKNICGRKLVALIKGGNFWGKIGDLIKFYFFKKKLRELHRKNLASKWHSDQLKSQTKEKTLNIKFFGKLAASLTVAIFFEFVMRLAIKASGLENVFSETLFQKLDIVFIIVFWIGIQYISSSYEEKNQYYLFDKSFSTLHYEFQNLFSQYKFKYFKFVFVVDELDFFMMKSNKLEDKKIIIDEVNEIRETVILPLIKAYKNLFQFINASFFFIGDDKLYEVVVGSNGGLFSTLFSDPIYLAAPKQKDLYNFIDTVISHNNLDTEDNTEFDLFKYYLMYSGSGDYRKTIFQLKDYANRIIQSKKHDGELVVQKHEFRNKEKNMASVYRLVATLYDSQVLDTITGQKYNDSLWKGLYIVIDHKIWSMSGVSSSEIYSNDSEIKKHQSFIIDYLSDLGILKISKDPANPDVNIINALSSFDYKKIPSSFDKRTTNEDLLYNTYDRVDKFLSSLLKQLDLTIEELEEITKLSVREILEQNKKIILKLNSEIDLAKSNKKYNRQIFYSTDIDPIIQELDELEDNLIESRYEILKSKIDKEDSPYTIGEASTVPQQVFVKLETIKEELAPIKHTIFYLDDDFSKRLILINDKEDSEFVQKYRGLINREKLHFSYFIATPDTNMKDIEKWMNNYIFNGWFVDSGIPQLLEDSILFNKIPGINYNGSGNLNTFLRKDGEFVSGNIKFRFKLEENGIFNVIIGYQKEEDGDKYWMARFDARSSGINQGSGILEKTKGAAWKYSKMGTKKAVPSGEWVSAEIDFSRKKISMQVYPYLISGIIKKKTIVSQKLLSRVIGGGGFGFSNEQGDVSIIIDSVKLNKE